MTTPLPPSNNFTDPGTTQGGFKTAITAQNNYLAGLFGTDGTAATARSMLGLSNIALTYNNRGAWATAQTYAVNDIVTSGGVVYNCVVAHTSGTFATDLAAGKWVIFQGQTSSIIGYTPMESGSVATIVQSKLREIKTVTDFGSANNGTTDEAAIISTEFAAVAVKNIVDCGLSRISVTPTKPSFDSGLAAFQSITWKQGIGVKYKGPVMENVYYSDFVSLPYGSYTGGVPVNESACAAPYHVGYVLDVKTPSSYGACQATHALGASIASLTEDATSFVHRRDGVSEFTSGIRSSTICTFTAAISGTALTSSAITSGSITVGMGIVGANVLPGTFIVSGSGTAWVINQSQTVAATPVIGNVCQAVFVGGISATTLTVSAITSGYICAGSTISYGATTCVIGNQTSGTIGGTGVYPVSVSQSVTGGTTMMVTAPIRRWNTFAETSGEKGIFVTDLASGYTSVNCQKAVMNYPFEIGAIANISTGTHVRPDLGPWNTIPTLRLENLTTSFNGWLTTHTSGAYMRLDSGSAGGDGVTLLQLGSNAGYINTAGSYTAPNPANCVIQLSRSSSTSRSINASGTINASGADYAEYENNNGLTIAKGSIVGFKDDGALTLTYSEAVRFGIKSTRPSYVGGDNWFSEVKPETPEFVAPVYTGPSKPTEPTTDEVSVWEAYFAQLSEFNNAVSAYKQIYDTALETYRNTDLVDYEQTLAAFTARAEAARALVDRVAYSGKVPVNVTGATPGGYIIAVAAPDGSITGQCVSKSAITFAQYQDAVGRVNKILPDGRAEVAVIIH